MVIIEKGLKWSQTSVKVVKVKQKGEQGGGIAICQITMIRILN